MTRTENRRRPSPALAISILALALAIGGGSAVALQGRNSVDSGDIKKNAVRSPDIAKNAVKSPDIAKDAVKPGEVASDAIGNSELGPDSVAGAEVQANSLGGADIDETSVGPINGDQRFSFSLGFGQSQQIAQYGPLSLLANCIQNTTDNQGAANQDVARVTIATTENGAVFRSNEDDKDGSAAANFLDTNTVIGERVVLEASAPTNTGQLDDNDDMFAMAPSGTRIAVANESSDQAVNLFGQACIFNLVITRIA